MTVTPQSVFPVFVGSGRSGTTLLRTIFDGHPELAVANEPQFMGTVARQRKRLESDGFDATAFLETVLKNPNYRRLELDQSDVESSIADADPSTVADGVRVVMGVFAAREGKPLYGDKTPGYVVQIPELARMFPEARFVHLIRDGRNVALSYIERPWGPSTVGEAALYWRSRVGRGRTAGKALGSNRYLEARYEDLVHDPETEVRRICAFLDLDFAPEMLQYKKAAERFIASSHQPEAFEALVRPPTSGLRDWTNAMDTGDIALFETIAGGLLSDLNYECRTDSHPMDIRLKAWWEEAKWSTRRLRAAAKGKLGA
jgi:Sulfotransferase family